MIKREFNKEPGINKHQLPYAMDAGLGWRARIGLIVLPDDQTIEYELRMIFDLPGVAFYVNRLYCAPTITPDTLKAMESEITRAAGLILSDLPLNLIAYGCTSGSLFIGPETIHARYSSNTAGGHLYIPHRSFSSRFQGPWYHQNLPHNTLFG